MQLNALLTTFLIASITSTPIQLLTQPSDVASLIPVHIPESTSTLKLVNLQKRQLGLVSNLLGEQMGSTAKTNHQIDHNKDSEINVTPDTLEMNEHESQVAPAPSENETKIDSGASISGNQQALNGLLGGLLNSNSPVDPSMLSGLLSGLLSGGNALNNLPLNNLLG